VSGLRAEPTALHGVLLLTPERHADARGWFMETYNERSLAATLHALGLPAPAPFVQDNHSCSAAGVLRGLHYQRAPHAQAKLVRVLHGASWHAAVDLRRSSPSFGRWCGVALNAQGARQLWLPAGIAHGFLALEDATEVAYKATALYARDAECALLWNDPALAIAWPAAPRLLSARDATATRFADAPLFD
jgi:dTDP-4-dehydrorhamnose 3,5-epimerase